MIVTIDIDSFNHFRFLKAYHNLSYFADGDVTVHRTRKGYHLTAFVAGVTPEVVLKIRALCGDDIDRLHYDRERINSPAFGALFQIRYGKHNEVLLSHFSSDNPF